MRIISGSCRGRKLVPLEGNHIRPTSDRTKEAVFNMIGSHVRDARVLDLFAGTGALGIEALSRGAGSAVFIDTCCAVVRQNLSLCGLMNTAQIIETDLTCQQLPAILAGQKFSLVFMDPPYQKGYIDHILTRDGFLDLLAEDAVVVAEYAHRENPALSRPGLDILKQKKYSKTHIAILTKTQ